MSALLANSETAEDIAASFLKFKEPLFEVGTEISAIISELFAISAALQELNTAYRDPVHSRRKSLIEHDLYTVLRSLEYTFKDISRLFGDLINPRYRTFREAYQGVWREINRHLQRESRETLVKRLEHYRLFLNDLSCIVQGSYPNRDFDDLQQRIEDLLHIQDEGLELDIGNMTLGTSLTPRQRSWERTRPPRPPIGLHSLTTPPLRDPRPRLERIGASEPRFRRPRSPLSLAPPRGGRYDEPYDHYEPRYEFPAAPEPPSSPTATTSTASSSQSASIGPSSISHWLTSVFAQSRPTTEFENSGSESLCFGPDMPGASRKLSPEYVELLRLPFETGSLETRFYIRPYDRRARILCKMHRGHERVESCYPLTTLRIIRHGSCLKICKPNDRNQLLLWSNLRFPSYERLVLYYCSFLALKIQDEATRIRKLDDHILGGEELVFNGAIIDDNYEHSLQILKDENSRGIRLQASALKGDLKHSPIWTAFINYKISSRMWIMKPEPNKVHLRDLTLYTFSHKYIPQLGPRGEHELCFQKPSDAQHFIDRIDDLAEEIA